MILGEFVGDFFYFVKIFWIYFWFWVKLKLVLGLFFIILVGGMGL